MEAIGWDALGVRPERILVPAEGVDMQRWAVIACDQHTSDVPYWEDVAALVGDAPSTLGMILPEVYLGNEQPARLARIAKTMQAYLDDGVLQALPAGVMVVERQTTAGVRIGVLLGVDLEHYEYREGTDATVRATEQTIVERIPPRLDIRRQAVVELPHILMLLDDPQHTAIRPLHEALRRQTPLYDFELMFSGGHIRAWHTGDAAHLEALRHALEARAAAQPFLLAVGDGNHSLATAKTYWEELKSSLSLEQQKDHPARFALCEVENLYDAGTEFEPIHRVLFGVRPAAALEFLVEWLAAKGIRADVARQAPPGALSIDFYCQGQNGVLFIENPDSGIATIPLQPALDALVEAMDCQIDYIHHPEEAIERGSRAGCLGLCLPALDKHDLFRAIASGGALPRKTFSMGEEQDKRYYIEGRCLRRGRPSAFRGKRA